MRSQSRPTRDRTALRYPFLPSDSQPEECSQMPNNSDRGIKQSPRPLRHVTNEEMATGPAKRVCRKPFFLVGCSRSGTTVLRLILNRHSDLAIPSESHFLLPLMEAYPAHIVLSPAQVSAVGEAIVGHPRFATWRTTSAELTTEVKSLSEPTLATLIDAAFCLEIAATGKSRWGDKTPEYCSHLGKLHEFFPTASFIHIVRDGRDVSNWLRNRTWYGWTELQRARHWTRTVGDAELAGRRIGSAHYLRVSYEDLVLFPQRTVKSICDFLQIDVQPAMFAFHEDAAYFVAESSEPGGHHQKLRRPPQPSDVYRWQRESSPLRIMLFESIAGRRMDQLGMKRRFNGVSRHLGLLATALYYPVGGAVVAMQRFYESMPLWIQSSWRQNQLLRNLKRAITRC